MELPYRTFRGIARIRALYARRISRHGADLLGNGIRVLAQADGVVVRLRHLLPVETGHFRRFGEQRLRLGQHHLAATLDVTEQALTVAEWNVLRFLDQRARRRQRLGIALLEKLGAQLAVKPGTLGPELADRRFGLLLKALLAAKHVVEAARDLARELDVRDLVLAHRNLA